VFKGAFFHLGLSRLHVESEKVTLKQGVKCQSIDAACVLDKAHPFQFNFIFFGWFILVQGYKCDAYSSFGTFVRF
jgi:hypothetical protein